MNDDRPAATSPAPRRVPGVPHPATVAIIELLPGTTAYADTFRDGPPVLVIDTGPCEVRLTVPGLRASMADVQAMDMLIEAVAAYRTALAATLD